MDEEKTPRFAVLVVGRTQVRRTPLVAGLLSSRLEAERFEVGAAATRPDPGSPDRRTITTLEGLGVACPPEPPRPVDAWLAGSADLVVTATLAERSTVLRLVPEALRRTFTLLELAELLHQAPEAGSLATLVESCAARRTSALRHPDLPDLDSAGPWTWRRAVRRIDHATRQVTDRLNALDPTPEALRP